VKTIAVFVLVVFVVAVLLFLGRRISAQKPDSAAALKNNPYLGLRQMAFAQSREGLQLPASAKPTQPWGAIMEWGTGGGAMTLVAFADGSASIYLSSGGGMIGGQGQKNVNEAARNMVAVAAKVQPQMAATSTFPLPKQGEVVLYVLTDAGLFSGSGTQVEFSSHRHALSELGDAAQNVITQYRLIQGKGSQVVDRDARR
jgi:hypothetical protein